MSRLGGMSVLVGAVLALVPLAQGETPAAGDKPQAVLKDGNGDPLPRGARQRLGTLRFRHGGMVNAVRYLPDGNTILSSGSDSALRYWKAGSGRELHVYLSPLVTQGLAGQGLSAPVFRGIQPNSNVIAIWALSPDATKLAIISAGNAIQVREVPGGKLVREIKLEEIEVPSFVRFSPDGKHVAAIVIENANNGEANKASIRLWDVASGQQVRRLVGPKPAQEGQTPFAPGSFSFSQDGQRLAALGIEFNANGRIRIWDLGANKEPIRLLEHYGTFNGNVVLSPDGKRLAEVSSNPITGSQNKLRLWDTSSGKQVHELGEAAGNVGITVFSPDGKRIAVTETNGQAVRIWDAEAGKETAAINNLPGVFGVTFSPDSKLVAVGTDRTVRLCEAVGGKERHVLAGYQNGGGMLSSGADLQGMGGSLAFSADGKTLAGAGGFVVRRWNVETGKEIRIAGEGHEDTINSVAISPDGKTVATAGSEGVRLWDVASGKALRQLPEPAKGEDPPAADPDEPIAVAVAYSPNGQWIAVGKTDGVICLYEAASGKETRKLEASGPGFTSLAFSPDSKNLVSAANNGAVAWWDVEKGKLVRHFIEVSPDGSGFNTFVAISPDGTTLATAGLTLQLWEVATGKLRREINTSFPAGDAQAESGDPNARAMVATATFIAYAPDGRTIAAVGGDSIVLWDALTGKELRRFGGQNGQLTEAVFSPNGKWIAGASNDGTVRLWEAANGTVRAHLNGHRGGVAALAFSPDGATLASTSFDTTGLLWDVKRCLEPEPQPAELSAKELGERWTLLGDDGSKSYESLARLAEFPKQSVALLNERLKPIPALERNRIARLMAELEDDRFEVRKRATDELEKLSELAEPALQSRLAENPPLEVKQRIERLLEQLAGPVTGPDALRMLRGIELLERIGTPGARQVLQKIAQGAPEARATQRAKGALGRLSKRDD
ncbi:MAG: WD40 repeat domain-containing protein [Gemmataceae bacterium]|nr:WD40 repeat domain-containing protein [Gemmataceae bacterium]